LRQYEIKKIKLRKLGGSINIQFLFLIPAFSILISFLFFIPACQKNSSSGSGSSKNSNSDDTISDDTISETCNSSLSIQASTQIPLLVIRVQYINASFQSNASTWSNKIFSSDDGNLNHYFHETTYGKYQFKPATESDGCSNDGIITVTMNENHPNTQKNSYACYAEKAIRKADEYIDFSQYDSDNNTVLNTDELQVMFLVAGGESASSINSPGGIWAMATSLWCDKNNDGKVTAIDGEYFVYLDDTYLLAPKNADPPSNGYSQFGERQGISASNTWDATIGIIAHELGHAYFDIPDLYCTSGDCQGIGLFGLMGAGSWGYKSSSEKSGATPVHMTAWTKQKISVCSPMLADNNTYTLPAVYQTKQFLSSCPIYKVDNDTDDTEYFLIENRSDGGYDSGLRILLENTKSYVVGNDYKGGILIWHFQDILSSCALHNNCQNASVKLLDLEEANNADLDSGGSSGRSTHLFYLGNNSTFDNNSNPSSKWNDNSSSGISITNISVAGDDMTITVSK